MPAQLLAGRYQLYDPIASGGMATVHYARLIGEAGFARTVAIKRVHQKHGKSGAMVVGLIDEARIASRIQHPNVVPTLDVFADGGELFVVMEFVMGETVARLANLSSSPTEPVPTPIAVGIAIGMLQGLHAAHEAKNERGQPLGIVHRDVSPQNVLVGIDGMARVLDFGIAKAEERLTATLGGQVKGKPRYMAPEQMRGESVSRRTDLFAAGIVLWELLSGRRMFEREVDVVMTFAQKKAVDPVGKYNPAVPAKLDAVLRRAMAFDPEERFEDAATFAVALEEATEVATARRIGEWVKTTAKQALLERSEMIAAIETDSSRARDGDDQTQPDAFPVRRSEPDSQPPPSGDVTRVGPTPDDTTVVVSAAEAAAKPAANAPIAKAPTEVTRVVPPELAPPASDASTSESDTATHATLLHSASAPTPAASPGWRRFVVLAAIALLAGASAAVLSVSWGTAPATSAAAAATSPSGRAVESTAPPLATSSPAVATGQATASIGDPPAASASPSATLSSSVKPATAGPRSVPAASTPAAVAKPNCTPPYTVDGNGVQRFKPECL